MNGQLVVVPAGCEAELAGDVLVRVQDGVLELGGRAFGPGTVLVVPETAVARCGRDAPAVLLVTARPA